MRSFVLLLPLAGCLGESSFPQRVADDICERYAQCRPLDLAQIYDDVASCKTDLGDSLARIAAAEEQLGCPWDADLARDCLAAIQEPCDTFSVSALLDVCARSWVCE